MKTIKITKKMVKVELKEHGLKEEEITEDLLGIIMFSIDEAVGETIKDFAHFTIDNKG